MRQRLSVAIATLNRPPVLLLDEPTAGVDPQARNHLLESVRRIATDLGTAVLYGSHYVEEIEAICEEAVGRPRPGPGGDGGTGRRIRATVRPVLRLTIPPVAALRRRLLASGLQVDLADDGTCSITTDDPAEAMEQVSALFRASRQQVGALALDEPNLETAFLALTGRRLRD